MMQVTGRLEPKYPKWKRMWKYYGVSVPVVLFCLWIAFNLMLFYFWMQVRLLDAKGDCVTFINPSPRLWNKTSRLIVISFSSAKFRMT